MEYYLLIVILIVAAAYALGYRNGFHSVYDKAVKKSDLANIMKE